jgi:hypothetical protein
MSWTPISWIGDAISGVAGIGKQWLANRNAKAQAKHDLQMATLENKAALMRSRQVYNQTWEIAALKETPKILRIASFTMFAGPILMNMFFPYFDLDSALMWVGLKQCPEWWVRCFTVMNGTIWGCMELREMGGIRGLLGTKSEGAKDGVIRESATATELQKWLDELDELNTKED